MGVNFYLMDILKKNNIPSFEIVSRKTLTISSIFNLELKNEMSQKKEVIFATISLLPNENYHLTLDSFPAGKIGDKLSYTLFQDNEVVLLGKILIASENQDIQDYSKKTNNKFYK